MCTTGCVAFATRVITPPDVEGRHVLEVGSYDVNGTLRATIEQFRPASYVGVDLTDGPGVDEVCRAESLLSRFGPGTFDLVVSTEMLEHVRDWRAVVANLKGMLAEDGILVLTTRSPGFPFHGYPVDFWRFSLADMRRIFGDMDIEALEPDTPGSPGVFIRARRRAAGETDLTDIYLYSIVRRRPTLQATLLDQIASATMALGHRTITAVIPRTARRFIRARLARP